MDLKIICPHEKFSTNIESLDKKVELVISIIDSANVSNWFSDNNKPSTDTRFITLTLTDQSVKATLDLKIKEDPNIYGFYVSFYSYFGILCPTDTESIWNIRMLESPPVVKELALPFQINSRKPSLWDIRTMLDAHRPNIPSNLSIDKSFSDLEKLASNLDPKIYHCLSMSPTEESNIPTSDSTKILKVIDPIEFLHDKYFTTLYSDSVMLEHFVKSSIPKMHLLRRDNLTLAIECLSSLMVESLSKFDRRHSFQIEEGMETSDFRNQWLNSELLINQMEENYRFKMLSKFEVDGDHGNGKVNFTKMEALNTYVDKLRLRDLKLQILIDMELLKILMHKKNEESETSDEKDVPNPKEKKGGLQKKGKQVKPTLERKFSGNLIGKKKKHLIPTLLGTVIPSNFDFDVDFRDGNEDTKEKKLSIKGLKKLLQVLFEKLCVWDAIMGLDYKDHESSWGFLSNCLVPFYDKHHHNLLNDLAIKSRGPAFILKLKSSKEKKERLQRHRQKKKLENNQKQLERKTTNIDLSQLKLNRSHSSFSNSSKVDLSRKTFSMVKSTGSLVVDGSFDDNNILETSFNSDRDANKCKGFMNSKRRKLLAPKKTHEKEAQQIQKLTVPAKVLKHSELKEPVELFHHNQIIEATPRKPRPQYNSLSSLEKRLTIVESSPVNKPLNEPNVGFTETQIAETPRIERVQIRPGVFEIGSSPMKMDVTPRINRTPTRFQIINSPSPAIQKSGSTIDKAPKSIKRKLNFE